MIKRKKYLLILGLLIGLTSYGQEREEELTRALFEKLNEYRTANQLGSFQQDEILEAAAFDQAKYIVETGKVVHEQENSKKRTLEDRVNFYEGLNADLGENATKISMGSKEQVVANGARVTINTDNLLLDAVIASWLKDEKSSKLNLLDPNFYKVGIAIIVDNETEVMVVTVFGSEPYVAPEGSEVSIKNHGIDVYNEELCKEFLTNYPSLPQLLSDMVKVQGDEVILRHHQLDFIQSIFSNSSDGIAFDLVDQKQFSCEGGNRLFPGSIANGFLMKPIKKGVIHAKNTLDSIGELSVRIGNLPSFYNSATFEINLVLIKNGTHCVTVPFNKYDATNTKNFELPFLLAGESTSNKFNWKDSIEFEYSLLKDWRNQKAKDLLALEAFNFKIESEIHSIQFSPLHQAEIKLDSNLKEEEIKVAWDSLEQYVKGSYYQLDLAELDKEGKIEFLKESIKEDLKLKSFLEGLNKLSIKLKGEGTLNSDLAPSEQLSLYQLFLKNNKIQPALFLQAKLLEKVRSGELKADELPQADPSQKENTLAVINNQIVLEHIMGAEEYGGNPLYLAFFELYLINKREVEVSFNYHVAKLKYWSENYANINDFPSWLNGFKKILTTAIPAEKYARAMLNYNLLAVDYYYEIQKFDQRKKAFTEILKWQSKANLSEAEILQLAKTLCYQDQFKYAGEILLPVVKKEKPSEELLFYFLQIARYNQVKVNEVEYIKYLKKAQGLYPGLFCDLFGAKKMGKQALKNAKIKKLYCESCN